MAGDVLNKWTVMIYMAGDNNLSETMAKSLQDITAKHKEVSFFVFFDSSVKNLPILYFDIEYKDADGNLIPIPAISTETYQQYRNQQGIGSSESSSTADSIVNFVKWCVKDKGKLAENYALILSGHSNGFDELTMMSDADSDEHLSVTGLRKALQEIKDVINEGKNVAKPLDILGFDSCSMGLLEIGYEFRQSAKYLIASEGETPIEGWDYQTFNFVLKNSEDKFKDPREVAVDFVATYNDQQKKYLLGGRSVDLNVWDLGKIEDVVKKYSELFKILNDLLTTPQTDSIFSQFSELIKQQIGKSILNAHWNCQTHWFNQAIDIQDFCEVLFSDIDLIHLQFKSVNNDGRLDPFIAKLEEIRIKINETIKAKFDCVIAHCSMGSEFQFSNGLAVFFPWSVVSYRTMRKTYKGLDFASTQSGKDWIAFLDNYLHKVTMRTRVISKNNLYYQINNFGGETVENTKRGTLENTSRGTLENTSRGTLENTSRGTLENTSRGGGLRAFRTFKNINPDNYNWSKEFQWWAAQKFQELKFSTSLINWASSQKDTFDKTR